jgi:hypothetical protein
MARNQGVVPFAGIAVLAIAVVIWLLPSHPIVDEEVHFAQAQMFANGNWQIHSSLSTWPTINVVVAVPLAVLGGDSLTAARAVIAMFAILAVVGFFSLCTHFDPAGAGRKTAQFFLLPIVLPYCGLVYTDIPALAAVLWMTLAALKQRFAIFSIAAVAAIAFRQVNIVWFVAGVALYAHELHRSESGARQRRMAQIAILGIGVAAAYALIIWVRGGIALTAETQASHALGPNGLPNIEFAIGLGGVLFAPILWSTRKRFLNFLRTPGWAILFFGLLLFVGYTFVVRHLFNTDPSLIDGFLRNRILFAITHTWLLWLFAVVVATAALGFCLLPFCRGAEMFKIPLYAIGLGALLPLGLIEQRYYLPLFALLWVFRAPVSETLERVQLALSAILAFAAVAMISMSDVFL